MLREQRGSLGWRNSSKAKVNKRPQTIDRNLALGLQYFAYISNIVTNYLATFYNLSHFQMKTIVSIALVIAVSLGLSAQTETVPAGFTGIHEIVIGAKFDAVKKFLDPKAVYSHATLVMAKESGDTVLTEENWGPKNTWLVKKNQVKFFTYMGASFTTIEVSFDENKQISHVRLLINKTEKNEGLIQDGSIEKFGNTPCGLGVDTPTFYCPWIIGKYKYAIGNFDAFSPEPDFETNPYIFVDFLLEDN